MIHAGLGDPESLQASAVTALVITRWILIRTLRSPLSWALLCFGGLFWPALARFTPVGITTASEDSAALVYEIAFLATLLGAVLGMHALGSIQTVLQRASPAARWRAEAVAIWTSAVCWAVLASAWPLRFGGVGEGLRLELVIALALGAAQLAALSTLLLGAQLPLAARSLGLFLLAWWIPSLLGTTTNIERWTSALLDVAANLRPPSEGWSPTALVSRLGPMIGLSAIAFLLHQRRTHETTPLT